MDLGRDTECLMFLQKQYHYTALRIKVGQGVSGRNEIPKSKGGKHKAGPSLPCPQYQIDVSTYRVMECLLSRYNKLGKAFFGWLVGWFV